MTKMKGGFTMIVAIQDPVQYAVWIELALFDLRKDARFHSEDELEGLSKSMVIKQLQNIIVCRVGDRYEVIVGVGRVQAARKNNWAKIRADVYEGLTEFQKLDMIFSENEDRKNASPLYQAQLLNGMQGTDSEKMTQEELADKIGKDQTTVSKYLSLMSLSPKIWDNMNAFIKFGMRHFIQLNRIENKDDQWKLGEIAREKGLSSSELGAFVDKHLGVKPGKKEGRPKGDKNLGADGFAFVQKGSNLRIKANCDLSGDLEVFLTQLKAAIVTWRETHPAKKTEASQPA
jgi:ParB family chromosome partitioning protein